eukprot:scaffold50976_cov32-Phaeocystis_antarctica.AAC.2
MTDETTIRKTHRIISTAFDCGGSIAPVVVHEGGPREGCGGLRRAAKGGGDAPNRGERHDGPVERGRVLEPWVEVLHRRPLALREIGEPCHRPFRLEGGDHSPDARLQVRPRDDKEEHLDQGEQGVRHVHTRLVPLQNATHAQHLAQLDQSQQPHRPHYAEETLCSAAPRFVCVCAVVLLAIDHHAEGPEREHRKEIDSEPAFHVPLADRRQGLDPRGALLRPVLVRQKELDDQVANEDQVEDAIDGKEHTDGRGEEGHLVRRQEQHNRKQRHHHQIPIGRPLRVVGINHPPTRFGGVADGLFRKGTH